MTAPSLFSRCLRCTASTLALASGLAIGSLDVAAQTPIPSAHFEAVRQKLDLGGPVFVFMDMEEDMVRIGRDLTKAVADVVGDDPDSQVFKQDYGKILEEIGIAGVKAIGMSSIARREGGYHNRGFVHIPEPRRGIFAALGGPARPFATARLAPADTDLFIETELDMPALIQALTTIAARFIPGASIDMLGGVVADQTGVDANEGIAALMALRGRITLLLRLGETTAPDPARMEEWGFGFVQKAQLLLRAEGIGQRLLPLLAKVDELKRETVNGRQVFRATESVPFLGDNQPALVIDGENVLLGSSLAFIEQSLTRGASLAQTPAFTGALTAIGMTEGNSLVYGTPRFYQLVRALIGSAIEMSAGSKDMPFGPILQTMIDRIPNISEPLASVTANVPDGVVMRANGASSLKAAMVSLAIYNPDILGPIALAAVPAAIKAQMETRKAARSVGIAEANLTLIGEAAVDFFNQNPTATEVTYKELEAVLAGQLGIVKDLDFTDFTLERGFSKIDLELPNGQTVTYLVPFSDADREAIRKNLALFDRAAVWYFRKNPGETVMLGIEAIEDGSPMKELPTGVRGEDYRQLQIRRTDDQISIEVSGETLMVKRDLALQQVQPQRPQPQRRPPQRQPQPQPKGG